MGKIYQHVNYTLTAMRSISYWTFLGKILKLSAAATENISVRPEKDEFAWRHQPSDLKIAIKKKYNIYNNLVW